MMVLTVTGKSKTCVHFDWRTAGISPNSSHSHSVACSLIRRTQAFFLNLSHNGEPIFVTHSFKLSSANDFDLRSSVGGEFHLPRHAPQVTLKFLGQI